MALNKLKGNLERILDKNLADLVRGIRNNKDNEVCEYILLSLVLSIYIKHCFSLGQIHSPVY